jgi:hypothetical protein
MFSAGCALRYTSSLLPPWESASTSVNVNGKSLGVDFTSTRRQRIRQGAAATIAPSFSPSHELRREIRCKCTATDFSGVCSEHRNAAITASPLLSLARCITRETFAKGSPTIKYEARERSPFKNSLLEDSGQSS